jgi:hypothetical protein
MGLSKAFLEIAFIIGTPIVSTLIVPVTAMDRLDRGSSNALTALVKVFCAGFILGGVLICLLVAWEAILGR